MRVRLPALAPRFAAYAALVLRPLRVTLWLVPGSTLAGNDPLLLDNLLARAVLLQCAADRGPLDDTPGGYEFPLPVRVLWRSDDGLPLYATTAFAPGGQTATDVTYLHKRQQSGAWTNSGRHEFSPKQGSGRWAERRQGLRSVLAEYWTADVIGHQDAIADLLRDVSSVGKKRGHGFGQVARWEIAPIPAYDLVRAGRLTRTVPAASCATLGVTPRGDVALVGFTPPQWKPSLFRPGYWIGTVTTEERITCGA